MAKLRVQIHSRNFNSRNSVSPFDPSETRRMNQKPQVENIGRVLAVLRNSVFKFTFSLKFLYFSLEISSQFLNSTSSENVVAFMFLVFCALIIFKLHFHNSSF